MTQKTHIILKNVDVRYSSLAYKAHSLKETIFRRVARKKINHVEITDVHALKNISFQIYHGERIGLIGHNGAGKSTLLKTIAQVYPLSAGSVDIIGDVRSLFELNLGFEMEATGRENIMYRGLLLGKKPKEMRAMIDEIIEFAELGDFIDYPIKTYSAGMIVRLAFSISTSVSGDILILDEVFSAGDAKFIVKAKKRITALIDNAELLIFASHEFDTLKELCSRVFVMHQGELRFDGKPADAIDFYHELMGLSLGKKTQTEEKILI
ncbi:MAG: ABC transporter system ATP binding protein [uncultured bacterium]|nr:MAG: ABC transporter system ATP binding protein [uncultured bacterium]OGT34293.1 MAG: polysaccharide/polyol phosphate ABC transporter ATP-binding protein [Gammaproteobacteria bacterium RIFCSPHIGHO2_02_FULL_39_13]OGT48942.1 MAG: polysaccharide/polyol phosphate ABC transporter ATP-binding protein [Gammaproteobacteria bacterium RIFCSPHIGHO2_12_FULL_39_24]